MKYSFDLEYLLFFVLAGTAVAFMIWVFWNVSNEIRGQVRSRVTKPLALRESESLLDEQTPGVHLEVRSWPSTRWQPRARRTTLTPRIVR